MSYRHTLRSLADSVSAAVTALWDRLDAGDITRAEFVELAAVAIAHGNARAVSLADVALAATLSVQLGQPVAPLGLTPPGDLDRLRQATATVADLGTPGRAARLGSSEPLAAAAAAYNVGIRQSPHAHGWTRQTDGDACPLCQDLADGTVLPDTVDMATHPGCTCIPVPVTTPGD